MFRRKYKKPLPGEIKIPGKSYCIYDIKPLFLLVYIIEVSNLRFL
jgi:hypothetical protein